MSREHGPKTDVGREGQASGLKVDPPAEAGNLPDKPPSAEDNYFKRKAEVTEKDYEEFLQYQQEKTRQNEARQAVHSVEVADRGPLSVDRRSFLSVVATTAAAIGRLMKNTQRQEAC